LGLKKADKLLLINSDDSIYVKKKYKRKEDDIFLFKNGVDFYNENSATVKNDNFTILFNGSWIDRKGISILIEAADILFKKHKINFYYLLIGTVKSDSEVREHWPEHLQKYIKVIPKFDALDEIKYLNEAHLFVLPSFFEGQPLSLLQAMSVGKCCITTNSCGQKDIITNDYNGLLISIGNSFELSENIYKCFNNSEISKRIGNNAKEDMKLRSWEIVSNEVSDFVIKNL
jgi:glycosyltransferase involved in cell wall biosynthesis